MKAARAGNVNAMSNAGVMLISGAGCKADAGAGRKWLEKAAVRGNAHAVKTLHDLFNVPFTDALTDEAYDQLLDDFCAAADESDAVTAKAVYERLSLGTDEQLSRLGLRLAQRRDDRGGSYWEYAYPYLNKHRSCAPVTRFWQKRVRAYAIVVNLRAFPEGEPALTFASSVDKDLVPV